MASEQGNESEIRQKLAELPGRNMNCDLLLQAGDQSFMARKDVLMLRMEYFRNMFNADMQEKDKMIIKLDPEIIDPTVFDELLDYVYTFDITLTSANLESIYRAADFFCFDELKAKIEIFMRNNMNKDNVSLLLDIAMKFDLKAQEEECKKLIILNPFHVSKTRHEVGYLNYTELCSLLQNLHDLAKFEDMFYSSMEWILYDKRNRSKLVSDLLQLVPLRRLSSDFCKQVISVNSIVTNDMKCTQLLLQSVIGDPPIEELYVFGGRDGEMLSSMSKYDSSARKWIELAPIPEKLYFFACVVVNQKIYVCGGRNGERKMNQLWMLNTSRHEWTSLKAMKHPREGCAMAVLNDHLYVAGGIADEYLLIVERYSLRKDKWEEVAPMIHKRGGLELVQVNGFLYAFGGYEGTDYVQSVERYNPLTDRWTPVINMNNGYAYFGSAVLNDRIYVLGKNCCEEYSPEENKWRTMASPTSCKPGRRLAVFDGKLYAIGGRIGEVKDWKGIKTVECYDFGKQTWTTTKNMNIARCHHSVAVVTKKYTPE